MTDEAIRALREKRVEPKSGTVRSAVVFLHGYGADAADLIGLAAPLASHLPDTLFLAPDAPEPCRNNPMGRQWFPIPWLDGSPPGAAEAGLDRAAADLNAWLDIVTAREGLAPGRVALFGFSQGTMMALHVALRHREPFACVVGFSGRLLRSERLAAEIAARPPVLLVHGDADQMVPFDDMARAGRALDAAGVPVSGFVMRGTGHGIADDGLSAALGFLADHLSGA
ncbi:MAG: alpha/beta hydrolase [Paracoccaceae bacterium]